MYKTSINSLTWRPDFRFSLVSLLIRLAPNTQMSKHVVSIKLKKKKNNKKKTCLALSKAFERVCFALQGPPTDAPAVDTAEQVYISSLALLKVAIVAM